MSPQMWRELRVVGEVPQFFRSRIFRDPPPAADPGMALLLISGVFTPDASLAPMAGWLKRMGYLPKRAGIRFNADCSEAEMGRLEPRLERAAERSGRRVAIVGWSRGGLFARALAVRRPELVAGILTLGSPLLGPLRYAHPLLQLAIELTTTLGDRGVPRLFTHRCADQRVLEAADDLNPISRAVLARARRRSTAGQSCCDPFWRDLRAPFPNGVEFVSLYSRTDGIVDWRGCLDPCARSVEVDASHCGMGLSKRVYRELVYELERIAAASGDQSAAGRVVAA